MTPIQTRALGRTSVEVSALSFGAAPIGNFRTSFTQSGAEDMIRDAWESGIRYFDTAPSYGNGLSEHRVGHALYGHDRADFTLSTKAGYVLRRRSHASVDAGLWVEPAPFEAAFDYSYEGVMRSVESSLDRLLTDHLDIVFMHDVDRYTHGAHQPEAFEEAVRKGFPALEKLRDEGVVRAIGFGVNEADVCAEAMRRVDVDCFLLAGRYTLLEQDPLDALLFNCAEQGIGIVLGGVYNSGILATGAIPNAHFNYGPAPALILEKTSRIEAVCTKYGVPLAAAALQFASAGPAVASICIGSRTPAQQQQTVDLLNTRIPPQLWAELRDLGLVRSDAPVPMA
ncbi:aldo/keto reductase [Nocardioides terrisoli]|uniref:aldo/keto reductase n=1 Tax=Nocardioides terrisoli TaxID=3388267 RepID=UPI00287B916C|nr:aldo/keto reductase [Nocardioides marmorisolisilvae]